MMSTKPVLITQYHPLNPNLRRSIKHKHWNIIQYSRDCATIFPHKPIDHWIQEIKNLKDMNQGNPFSPNQKRSTAKSSSPADTAERLSLQNIHITTILARNGDAVYQINLK